MKQKKIKNERGQAMVEFAIVLPFLLLILCGILDFGWIYYNKYMVEDASYQGARYAFVAEAKQQAMNPAATVDAGKLEDDTEKYVKSEFFNNSSSASVDVVVSSDKVTVTVENQIDCLTFVGQTFFGKKYNATSKSVASK
ncbi:MAG: pilus assembly protein [Eubacterium sp.]|nr:pilus assembly protein [Eubacterium sp.]